MNELENMNIVIVGHVDHGKSTLVGRLLADTGSLPDGKLEAVKRMCELNSKVFEYAFLLDALENERDQGITIDMARCFFQTEKRRYLILDAPGHIEFLKNMVTGASRAEAAILLIDAHEGIRENSRRHGLLAAMLGIKQLIVCVNKMDLVGYKQEVFEQIKSDYTAYLKSVGVTPLGFVPVAALSGENLSQRSKNLSWYKGKIILEFLDSLEKEIPLDSKPFRMTLQDVYKFTSHGDSRRIFAGRVEAGNVAVGDEVIFLPSQKRSKVQTVEFFGHPEVTSACEGQSTGLTLAEQIYVQRGELICKVNEVQPETTSRLRVNLFWMGRKPMQKGKKYYLKVGTAKVEVILEKINHIIDSQATDHKIQKDSIERHDVAECILQSSKPVAFDLNSNIETTSRFVIVDDYEICGGGIVRESLTDDLEKFRNETLLRELKFVRGSLTSVDRSDRYGQQPLLVVVTGSNPEKYKQVAGSLEEILFRRGRMVYFLGLGTVKYGIDSDLLEKGSSQDQRGEHIRRLGEASYLILDSGMITIVTARDLDRNELRLLETITNQYGMLTITVGEARGIQGEIAFAENADHNEIVAQALQWMVNQNKITAI